MDPSPTTRVCLNCGTGLYGSYCHCCGQKDQNRRIPLTSLFHDVVHDMLHWDKKVLGTLWLVFARPGLVAQEYLEGRRIRHVPPFRLYIVTSFILFLALSAVPVATKAKEGRNNNPVLQVSVQNETTPSQSIQEKRKRSPWEESLRARSKKAQDNPELFKRTFLSNLSKSLFILMPIFAALLMLLHWRAKSLFVDHMVVTLYHHVVSFVVILGLIGLAELPGDDWGCVPGALLLCLPPLHLAMTLQHLYRRGWFRSVVKAGLVSLLYGLLILGVLAGLMFYSLPAAN